MTQIDKITITDYPTEGFTLAEEIALPEENLALIPIDDVINYLIVT